MIKFIKLYIYLRLTMHCQH